MPQTLGAQNTCTKSTELKLCMDDATIHEPFDSLWKAWSENIID